MQTQQHTLVPAWHTTYSAQSLAFVQARGKRGEQSLGKAYAMQSVLVSSRVIHSLMCSRLTCAHAPLVGGVGVAVAVGFSAPPRPFTRVIAQTASASTPAAHFETDILVTWSGHSGTSAPQTALLNHRRRQIGISAKDIYFQRVLLKTPVGSDAPP